MGSATISPNRSAALSRLPLITCSMNASRMTDWTPSTSARPISGSTFGAALQVMLPLSRAAATRARAEVLPAKTTGQSIPPWASDRAAPTANSSSPPSVPPTNRTRSAADRCTSGSSDSPAPRVRIATIRPPEFSATCLAASAVRSRSSPTMATRSPPPALEQPSTTPSPAATIPEARNCRSPAQKPSIRSDSTVVRYCAEPTSAPDRVFDGSQLRERASEVDEQGRAGQLGPGQPGAAGRGPGPPLAAQLGTRHDDQRPTAPGIRRQ